MVYSTILKKIQKELVINYSPLAIGIFGSGAKKIKLDSDVDIYVLKEHLPRKVIRRDGLVFEVYFEDPKNISDAILYKEVRIIDRFRNSRPVYDPEKVYFDLINQAKKQVLREEEWREKTIIGADYDLVERTSINVRKCIELNDLESAVMSIQYLMDRIIEVGFRRLNISEYANPKKIPSLVANLPNITSRIYKQVRFSDIRDSNLIKKIIEEIEQNKLELFPPLK